MWVVWCYLVYALFIIRFYKGILIKSQQFDIDYTNFPEHYQPFIRYDYKNWNQLEIYFCALFILPFRIVGILITLLPCYLTLRIFSIGMKIEDEWSPFRYRIASQIVKLTARYYMVASGFYHIPIHNVQYSTYDPEYKQSEEDRVRLPAIIVSNHQSWYDTIFYVGIFMASYLSKSTVAKYPIFGPITTSLKSIYVERDSREAKDTVLEQIKQRQKNILEGKLFPPVIIFPEGTSTNGRYLISFKKGAFETLQPVKICCLKYHDRNFCLSLDKLDMLSVAALSLVQFQNKLELYEFEGVFNPAFLKLEQYPEEQRWQIYAQRVKNIMAKCLGKKQCEYGFRHSQQLTQEHFSPKRKTQ